MLYLKHKLIKYKWDCMNFSENIAKLFKKYHILINNQQAKQFCDYNDYLIETNKIHNLTNITSENEVMLKHFLDSVLPIYNMRPNSKIIDIGCGAGFPSIPLKILENDFDITAVDSVNKKVEFVSNCTHKLGIDDKFICLHARIEDIAQKKEFREQFDYVVSRAVAPLNIILEYSAPLCKNNGIIIAYKGINYKDEIQNSQNALNVLNCKIIDIKEYYIEEINTTRYILFIEKQKTIPNIYPRRKNLPRNKPL